MASSGSSRMSRDDFRKAKELEELRKTGAAPPELDDEGKMINPHIPQYISAAPWYYHTDRPGLKHQYHSKYKLQQSSSNSSLDIPSKSVIKVQSNHSNYIEGSCSNCGSLTHKVKECVERPRKKTAKYGGEIIDADIIVKQSILDYDGKRDRWNGYDPKEYTRVVQLYEKAELERKKKKLKELEEQFKMEEKQKQELTTNIETATESSSPNTQSITSHSSSSTSSLSSTTSTNTTTINSISSSSSVTESDLDKLKRLKREKRLSKLRKKIAAATSSAASSKNPDEHKTAATGSHSNSDTDSDTDSDLGSDDDVKDYGEVITKMDTKSRTTVRNLRIREDTAKYLRNLHPNSAYYDPKTRSMRENPYPDKKPEEVLYAGDNFVRSTGVVKEIQQLQRYVWEKNEQTALQRELGMMEDTEKNEASEEIHPIALPSAAEKLFNAHKQKRDLTKAEHKHQILHQYGGESHLIRPSPELLLNVTEQYVEYDEEGRVIAGREREMRKSRYNEDVRENGHTQVWGSYITNDGKWGYQCCHATIRHCICLGETGKSLKTDLERDLNQRKAMIGTQAANLSQQQQPKIEDNDRQRQEKRSREESNHTEFRNKQGYYRENDDAPTRSNNSITETELEVYHRNKTLTDDPINNFVEAV